MSSKIQFLTESVALPDFNWDTINAWITDVAKLHNRILGNITYIFCNDDKIINVNRQFLQHDYYTDIITFDYSRGKLISGDMFISLDTVKSNSEQFGYDYNTELLRVIIHGILHLCGIDDKGPGEREIMELHENQALKLIMETKMKTF